MPKCDLYPKTNLFRAQGNVRGKPEMGGVSKWEIKCAVRAFVEKEPVKRPYFCGFACLFVI